MQPRHLLFRSLLHQRQRPTTAIITPLFRRFLSSTTPNGSPSLRKPMGAFRGGIFGFLLGCTTTGIASYFYIYEEYKLANDLLNEDIDGLRMSVQRLELHLRSLEEVIAEQQAKPGKK